MKLSEMIIDVVRFDDAVWDADQLAAATIARLHECVKPLRFEEMRNNYWGHKSHDYQVAWNIEGVWRVRLNGKVICPHIKGHPAAVQWANAHYAKRIIAGFEL